MRLELVAVPVTDVDRAKAPQVVVDDAEALRDELRGRGVETSAVDRQPRGWFI